MQSFAQTNSSESIVVSPEITDYYIAMTRDKRYRWITFRMSDDESQLIVDQHGARDSTYESLLAALPTQYPCWVLLNFDYRTARGPNSKLMFIMWVPDIKRATLKEAARVKFMGVLYSSLFKPIFKAVSGNIQAHNLADMEWENVLQKASKFELDPVDSTWRLPQDIQA
eukprot:Phypoly_transcript_15538.p1 GENE.Phypoly_transcript_15538~~Phypoly_transcript_15538.p1  ORF type:complete len:169 (+),score=18.95 Phypoly_transcript_15538:213-719(+)